MEYLFNETGQGSNTFQSKTSILKWILMEEFCNSLKIENSTFQILNIYAPDQETQEERELHE